MTRLITILFVMLGMACAGCTELSSNPKRAERTIAHWLPVGTTHEDVTKIMKQHGFEFGNCNIDGTGEWDYYYGRSTTFHTWGIQIRERGGKVDSTNFTTIVRFTLIEFRT